MYIWAHLAATGLQLVEQHTAHKHAQITIRARMMCRRHAPTQLMAQYIHYIMTASTGGGSKQEASTGCVC